MITSNNSGRYYRGSYHNYSSKAQRQLMPARARSLRSRAMEQSKARRLQRGAMNNTYVIYLGICALVLLVVASCCGMTDPKIEAQYEDQLTGCKAKYSISPIEEQMCEVRVNHNFGR